MQRFPCAENVCNICVIINIVCNLLIENILEILVEEGNEPTVFFSCVYSVTSK